MLREMVERVVYGLIFAVCQHFADLLCQFGFPEAVFDTATRTVQRQR